MKVLIDTCVWSLALRRAMVQEDPYVLELKKLILDGNAQLIGPVRQELLSGIKDHEQFDRLKTRLRAFPDLEMEQEDYEQAADFANYCRKRGIQGSNTDFLICALSKRRSFPILTIDKDFAYFKKQINIILRLPRNGLVS